MKITYKGFIYESILLEAYTIDDIDKKFGPNLKKWMDRNGLDPEGAYEILLHHIEKADNDTGKKWLGSITKWLLEKRPEDLVSQIVPSLKKFNELIEDNPGKQGALVRKVAKSNISYSDFISVLNQEKDLTNKSPEDVKNTISKKVGDFPMIAENNRFVMYLVDKWIPNESGVHFCFKGDVEWCVKHKEHFEGYAPPYYYVLSKETGREFALMHLDSNQLKDVNDNELDDSNFSKIADMVLPIIEKSNCTLENDFKVIKRYVYDNNNIMNNYPNIMQKIKTSNFIKLLKTAYDEESFNLAEKMVKDLDITQYSAKIIQVVTTEPKLPESLIHAIFENKYLDVNKIINSKSCLAYAIYYLRDDICKLIVNHPSFNANILKNNHNKENLFIDLCYYSGNRSDNRILLNEYGAIVLNKMSDDVIKMHLDDSVFQICEYTLFDCLKVLIDKKLLTEDLMDNAFYSLVIKTIHSPDKTNTAYSMIEDLVNGSDINIQKTGYFGIAPYEYINNNIKHLDQNQKNGSVGPAHYEKEITNLKKIIDLIVRNSIA